MFHNLYRTHGVSSLFYIHNIYEKCVISKHKCIENNTANDNRKSLAVLLEKKYLKIVNILTSTLKFNQIIIIINNTANDNQKSLSILLEKNY